MSENTLNRREDRSSFVLITPAHNEVEFIEKTIHAVTSQTILPKMWVIVNDGSTDATKDIIDKYSQINPWIKAVHLPEKQERNFSSKVEAFEAGYKHVRSLSFEIIGSLDADITFDEEYFAFLLDKFSEDNDLGVAGTPFVDDGEQYDYQYTNIEHVSGACQLFRRECFEHIGGYIPIKGGGIDWAAVTTARMKGWKTKTFTEKVCFHHRRMGTGQASSWVVGFKRGEKDYMLGGHPLWQLFRCIYQMTRKPYLISGISLLTGFCSTWIRRAERPISRELIEFHRREQMVRLKKALLGSKNI